MPLCIVNVRKGKGTVKLEKNKQEDQRKSARLV